MKLLRAGIESLCDFENAKCFPDCCNCTCGVVLLTFSHEVVSYLSVGGFFQRGREEKLLLLYFHNEV